MNPSYFRINLDKAAAISRLSEWLGVEIDGVVETELDSAVDKCLINGSWAGPSLYFYSSGEWTVFEDLSGHYSAISTDQWLLLAKENKFVFAGYNDAIGYGEYIEISNGKVQCAFFEDTENPEDNFSIQGELPSNITSWIDVAALIDEDKLYYSDSGWVWVNVQKS